VGLAVGVGVWLTNSSDGTSVGVGVKMVIVGIWPSLKKVLPSILLKVSASKSGLKGSSISGGRLGEGSWVKARKTLKNTQKMIVMVVKTTIVTRLGVLSFFIFTVPDRELGR
jgi:hypothetical protein